MVAPAHIKYLQSFLNKPPLFKTWNGIAEIWLTDFVCTRYEGSYNRNIIFLTERKF